MRLIRFVICLCVCLLPALAAAKDFFLTIGGGPRPDNNQVSLERNVQFHEQVLAERRPDGPSYELYFADGKTGNRDLQYRTPDFKITCPPAGRILAEVLGDAASMDLFYRSHALENATGPSDPQILRRRLRDLARELKPGDRLFLYATAHGGPAKKSDDKAKVADKDNGTAKDRHSDPQVFNTSLSCWNTTSITASEFADWLDSLDPEVSVMLVMVQCYSGGFAQTIFNGADADRGLAPHARFGFFAQVHDRPAAGCTPDIDQADYQEYSSFFWAALAGRTRAGAPITSADYDKDGTVSFAEAHAYAALRAALEREAAIEREHLDLERQRAKVERLLRTAENIVLATNLPQVTSPEIVSRHEKLRRLEESTLAPGP